MTPLTLLDQFKNVTDIYTSLILYQLNIKVYTGEKTCSTFTDADIKVSCNCTF